VVTTPVRDRPDACPGALRTHRAADGLLVRLRLPGGRLAAASARGLAEVAERHADGAVHLTSRGNLQLRGVTEMDGGADPALVAAIQACGLLPSPTHELVRNVVASPWSGRRGGLVDLEPVVAEVDHALCEDPALAELPGRFLVALDDGTGDVAGLYADVTWWAQDAGSGALLFGGHDTGVRVAPDRVAAVVVEVAHAFLEARSVAGGAAWHVGELPGGAAGFGETVAATLASLSAGGSGATDARLQPPAAAAGLSALGTLPQDDGRSAVAALVPLGRLDAVAVRLLADAGELAAGRLIVTPWREVVVPDVARRELAAVERLLAEAGLVTDAASPWRRVSACVGRPSCARALADVREMAAQIVNALGESTSPTAPRLHLAGCERRCGRPASAHREVVAEPTGYSVADVGPAPADGDRVRRPVTRAPDVPPAVLVPILSEEP
jgi:precorrin-3B synthase